jgi:hypothetical protein
MAAASSSMIAWRSSVVLTGSQYADGR